MFLVIHNLPADIQYQDIKSLILSKCGLEDVILDNLVMDGRYKKVTVGLADDSDAAILVRKINGLFMSGKPLYVVNAKLKKASEQPYRSNKTFPQKTPVEYQEPSESRSYVDSGYDQEALSVFNNGSLMFNPSQGMYNPNGQVLWDQAANIGLMYSMGTMGAGTSMGSGSMGVGRTMYTPSVAASTPFPDFGGQLQSQTGITPQGVQPARVQRVEEDKRQWGDSYGKAHQATFDTAADRIDDSRQLFDNSSNFGNTMARPARLSRREESSTMSRATELPMRSVSPKPLDVWPRSRLESHDNSYIRKPYELYDPEDNFQELREPVDEHMRRDAFAARPLDNIPPRGRPEATVGRGSAPDYQPRQSRPIHPWENSTQSSSFKDREIPSRNNTTIERFDNPKPYQPWQQKSFSDQVTRPMRSGPRFDKPQTDLAQKRNFDKPGLHSPRFSQNDSVRAKNWNAPRANFKDQPFSRNDKSGGANKRPLFETRDTFAPKPFTNRRDRDEPPSKRFAGPSKFNTATVKPSDGGKAKPSEPPKVVNIANKAETWRGQATSQLAKVMIATLGLPIMPPREPVMVSLKRSIRARIDAMTGDKNIPVPVDDIIRSYREKFDSSTDRELYNNILAEKTKNTLVPGSNGGAVKSETKPQGNQGAPKTEPGVAKKATTPNGGQKPGAAVKKSPAGTSNKPAAGATATDRLPKYPGQNKSSYQTQKKMQMLEMKEELYTLEPQMQKVLDDESDVLCDLFMGECDGATDAYEQRVCERISDHVSDEFRKVVRLMITKRILDIKTSLLVRVLFGHTAPKVGALNQFLQHYGALSLKKSTKSKMYIVTCDSYANYDALCLMESATVDGVEVKFKPLYLTGPAAKVTRAQILQQRQQYIQSQIGKGNFLDKIEFPTDKQIKRKDNQPAVESETLEQVTVEGKPESNVTDDVEIVQESFDNYNMEVDDNEDVKLEDNAESNVDEGDLDVQCGKTEGENVPDECAFDEEDLEEW